MLTLICKLGFFFFMNFCICNSILIQTVFCKVNNSTSNCIHRSISTYQRQIKRTIFQLAKANFVKNLLNKMKIRQLIKNKNTYITIFFRVWCDFWLGLASCFSPSQRRRRRGCCRGNSRSRGCSAPCPGKPSWTSQATAHKGGKTQDQTQTQSSVFSCLAKDWPVTEWSQL